MCLPNVVIVPPCVIAIHMSHHYYFSFYNEWDNTIYVNDLYGMRWGSLLHEFGHWFLCLLPRCEATYLLNEWYDEVDGFLQRLR